jgi:glycosyltransferase involved in cell wall biosynthesis
MKILIVCSGKPSNPNWSFKLNRSYVYEQAESLRRLGIKYDTYFIEGNGISGYLKNYKTMMQKIKKINPDLIHAHYGLSGLLANLQRKVPVITTFHGSDINVKTNRPFSYLASRLSIDNIFVHPDMPSKINYKKKINLIPCGVDTKTFFPIEKKVARDKMNLEQNCIYALFTSSFTNRVKNYPLAKKAISKSKYKIRLIELSGYNREEVNLLMNAVDFLIITSHSETGPIVAKEAMCCNCPIVSVDVGDVKYIVNESKGSYICNYDAEELASSIDKIIESKQKTNGREYILDYDLNLIAKKVLDVYKKVV